MGENIHGNQHEARKMKITVTNFQKIDDEIKTGFHSTCEIDFEVCYPLFTIGLLIILIIGNFHCIVFVCTLCIHDKISLVLEFASCDCTNIRKDVVCNLY